MGGDGFSSRVIHIGKLLGEIILREKVDTGFIKPVRDYKSKQLVVMYNSLYHINYQTFLDALNIKWQ